MISQDWYRESCLSRSLAPAPPRGRNPGQIWVAVLNINTWEHRRNPCICTFCLPSECVVQKKYKSFIYILSSMMLGSESSFRVLNSAEKADGVSGQKCWDNLKLGQGGLRTPSPLLWLDDSQHSKPAPKHRSPGRRVERILSNWVILN